MQREETSEPRPGAMQRSAAIAAIALLAAVFAITIMSVVDDARRLVVNTPLMFSALFAAWYALTRAGVRRMVGLVVCLTAVAALVVSLSREDVGARLSALVRVVILLLAAALARFALGRDIRSLKNRATPGIPVPPAARGVLLMNLKSGAGKAERFHLPDECRRRGIEPVVLAAGDDLRQLAHDAIDRGADVLGMAGGDGSQALVATVAADRGVPMVVVPAGTRNHLALDLGLDRDDVVGALDAFEDAVERPMDLADVNGHVFVNNVSLGVYASIVRSPAYRDAKIDTTLATLPKVLGPKSPPFDLRFAGPHGEQHDAAHLVMISNNPYGNATIDTLGSRPRLDTKRLGVIALEIRDDRAASQFLTAIATKRVERFAGFSSWTAETFEVTSSAPIDVGLDGESLSMDPPLTFAIREQALRVRLPRRAIGYSPAARASDWRSAIRDIWRTALGRPTSREVGTETKARSQI